MSEAPDREMTFGNSPYVVFRVQITPDVLEKIIELEREKIYKHKTAIKDDPLGRKGSSVYNYRQTYIHQARESEWGGKYKKSGLQKLIKLKDAGNKKTLERYNKIRNLESIPDTFVIVVGVIDKAAYHEGIDLRAIKTDDDGSKTVDYDSDKVWHGKDYSYKDFFKILCDVDNGQFDPLALYRSPSAREKIEHKLLSVILNVLKRKNPSKQNLSDVVKRFGRELRDSVRDYIKSGDKPNLSPMTEGIFRPAKADVNNNLYGFGDGGSLIETGQLLFAIEYDSFTEQSSHMRSFVHRLLREHDAEIKRLKDEEREAKKKSAENAKPKEKFARKPKETKTKSSSRIDADLEYDLKIFQKSEIRNQFLSKINKYGRAIEYWPENEKVWYNKSLRIVNSINAWMKSHGRRVV